MKKQKPPIKIIKRNERAALAPPAPARAAKETGAGDLTRKANSTVADWVREFQSRRLDEQQHALANLRAARAFLQEREPQLTPAGV